MTYQSPKVEYPKKTGFSPVPSHSNIRRMYLFLRTSLSTIQKRSSNGRRLCTSIKNDFDYDTIHKDFKWNIPAQFNFAQDVIDKYGMDPQMSKVTAYHHMSNFKEDTRWTFQELSQHSKAMASALLSLGPINKAMIVLPRIPEWWLLNLAALRTDTILLPGTTQLTPKDISRYSFWFYLT